MRIPQSILVVLLILAGTGAMWTLSGHPPAVRGRRGTAETTPRTSATVPAPETRILGVAPLCEPSAVLALDDGALLLADNEGGPDEDKPLWTASVADGWIQPDQNLPAWPGTPKDVEALARLGEELWIFGSFSRNKDCEPRPARRAALVAQLPSFTAAGMRPDTTRRVRAADGEAEEIVAWDRIESDPAACAAALFTEGVEAAPVCEAIVAAARSGRPGACGSFNLEAAVGLPDGSLWVGLRAPVIDQSAILLRVDTSSDNLRFSAWRPLALEGRGVRELALMGDTIWGIAGDPTEVDGREPRLSALFTLPADGIQLARPTVIREDLPSNAEGLHIGTDTILLTLDGSAGGKRDRDCEVAARQIRRPFP